MEYEILKTYFDIQKPFYYPGEQVLGSIFIEFFDSINCSQISIITKGKQYIKINRKNMTREIEDYEDSLDEEIDDNNGHNDKYVEDIDEINTIFKYKKNLKIGNEYISKGKYTFPLEIDIPDNIPGSFLYVDNDIYFEIIYTIKIKFEEINYKDAIAIIIRQKEKIFNYPKSNEYKKYLGECCWERGETSIKISPIEKYNLINKKIKLNILINNEQSGMPGTPLNLEVYQKLVFFPKDKSKKIKRTKLVGKAKGINAINPRKNFNEDISIKLKENKILTYDKEKTKAFKYFKNAAIIELLTPSIKSELVICEYDIYVESQFVGWFKEELGVFNKILIYPPEKGILLPDMENISKEFLNSLIIKKIFLNNDIKDDEIILGKNKKEKKDKKDKKEKVLKNKKNQNREELDEFDKENYDINKDDINENFNINEYKRKNINSIEEEKHNYNDDINTDKFKKKLGKDFFDDHPLDDDFYDNTSEN